MNLRHLLRFAEDGLATVMDLQSTLSTPAQTALVARLAADLDTMMRAQRTEAGGAGAAVSDIDLGAERDAIGGASAN